LKETGKGKNITDASVSVAPFPTIASPKPSSRNIKGSEMTAFSWHFPVFGFGYSGQNTEAAQCFF
jgi:hypothetical protein